MQNIQKKESWKLKIIKALGLQSLIERNIIFKPPTPGYRLLENQRLQKIEFQPIINKKKYAVKEINHLKFKMLLIKELEQNQMISLIPVMHVSCRSDSVIIFSHGNASDLGDVFSYGFKICEIYNVDVILYDYTGYGYSKQNYKPTEAGIYRDLENVLAFACLRYKKIYLWGFSLGSAPTIHIGSKYQVSGLILQAPLASIGRVIDNSQSFMSKHDTFTNYLKISQVQCPMFIFHGSEDQVIPIEHSQILIQSTSQPIVFIPIQGAGHNELSFYVEQPFTDLAQKLKEFFHKNQNEIAINQDLISKYNSMLIEDRIFSPNYSSTLHTSNLIQKQNLNGSCQKETCSLFCNKNY